jgi:hypothetical protein
MDKLEAEGKITKIDNIDCLLSILKFLKIKNSFFLNNKTYPFIMGGFS